MIQRIQSVFLLVAAAANALLFKVNFYSAIVGENEVLYSAWRSMNIGSNEIHTNIIHIALQFALILFSIYTILKYKDRRLQMKFCVYLILGTLASFSFSLYNLFTTNYSTYHFNFGTYLISFIVMLYISSYFFIKKDDNLVKSVDRLRD